MSRERLRCFSSYSWPARFAALLFKALIVSLTIWAISCPRESWPTDEFILGLLKRLRKGARHLVLNAMMSIALWRGWSLAARGIAGEVRRWQLCPCFFDRRNDAPLRLYFVPARE